MHNIVLLGVTGDLAKKKLIPSLARISLYKKVKIFGFGRKKMSQKEFGAYLEMYAREAGYSFRDSLEGFSCVYVQSELDDLEGYKKLYKKTKGKALVYMALPPAMQLPVSKLLIESSVVKQDTDSCIAFEKPFGSNSTEARRLNEYLAKKLNDTQILRVDHYAGKETLLDLESSGRVGVFSFLSTIFPIEQVNVSFKEKISADMRGSFYDSVGALSDVGQNHMLHMLTTFLSAFAEPCVYSTGQGTCLISSSATGSLKAIRSILSSALSVTGRPLVGQYKGFRNIQGVNPKTNTETYFRFELKLAKPVCGEKEDKEVVSSVLGIYRIFKNTKFVFEAGKNMPSNDVSISMKGKSEYKLMINRNCGKDAYDEIFTALIEKNVHRFVSFEQIVSGWKLIEDVKKRVKGPIVEYSVGTVPVR